MTPGGWRLVDGMTRQVICSVPFRSVNAPGNEKPDSIWSPPPIRFACRGRLGSRLCWRRRSAALAVRACQRRPQLAVLPAQLGDHLVGQLEAAPERVDARPGAWGRAQ